MSGCIPILYHSFPCKGYNCSCNPTKMHNISCHDKLCGSLIDHELIEITTKPKSAEKIRVSFYRQNISPIDRLTNGAEGIRKFYNDKNLKRRKLKVIIQ